MKIVIAPDSFKGSATALQAAQSIEAGVKKALPSAETVLVPIADGGEGTMEALVAATNGHLIEVQVTGPMRTPVQAAYGLLGGGTDTCVIEMASASGLVLVPESQRNPLHSTSYGTGELIRQALDDGFRRFIIGLGGSATNDGGVGMLQALGMRVYDRNGQLFEAGIGGSMLGEIAKWDADSLDPRIRESTFVIASDVQNPLVGPTGATHIFGPQKGATPEMVESLEQGMSHWAGRVADYTGIRLHDLAGAGAAGGMGGAFRAFFPCTVKRGIDIVITYTRLASHLQGADLLFTGEGKIDGQTASGKAPMGVAQEAKKQQVPVIALAGSVGEGLDFLHECGITSIHSITSGPMSLEESMERAAELLEKKAEQIIRAYLAGRDRV